LSFEARALSSGDEAEMLLKHMLKLQDLNLKLSSFQAQGNHSLKK
jgi:hypothetical protein